MPIKIRSNGKRPAAATTSRQVPASKGKPGQALPYSLPDVPSEVVQLPAGVSLCMIVKNEERYLEQCLKSICSVVDEICIVDTGSTDRTIEIATKFGARIEHHAWRDDFAWARNKAIEMATKRWIIMLDADEELSPESRKPLAALKTVPADTFGLYLRCENLSDDYKGPGTMSHLLARIFPNNPRIRYISPIHEYVTIDGRETGVDTRLSDIHIVHHGYLQEAVLGRNKAARNLAMIKKACDDHPDDPFHWYNLGMTAHVVKDYPTAIDGFERMRKLLGTQERGFLAAALVTLAECYSEMNQVEKGLEVAEHCIRLCPRLTNAHFTLGRLYAKLGRREEARQAFIEAIEDRKYRDLQFVIDDQVYQWKAQLSLGVSLAEEQRWDEAVEWYDRGLANQPNVQPLIFNRAHALEGGKRFEEAEAAFRDAYEHFKDEISVVQYINYLLRQGQRDRALELMNRTVDEVSPRIAATFFVAAAQFAQRAGNPMDELQYLQRARECDPAAGPVIDALEQFYLRRNDQAMLNALHEDELLHEPKEYPDFSRRSMRLLALERYEEAVEYAEKGLKLAPTDGKLRYNAAAAHVKLGNHEAALEHVRVIPLDAPDVAQQALLLRAVLLRDAGQPTEALPVLGMLLSRYPNLIEAVLVQAQCYELAGQSEKASEALEAAFKDGAPAERHRIAIELGSLYLRMGRFPDAQRIAEAALAGA